MFISLVWLMDVDGKTCLEMWRFSRFNHFRDDSRSSTMINQYPSPALPTIVNDMNRHIKHQESPSEPSFTTIILTSSSTSLEALHPVVVSSALLLLSLLFSSFFLSIFLSFFLLFLLPHLFLLFLIFPSPSSSSPSSSPFSSLLFPSPVLSLSLSLLISLN